VRALLRLLRAEASARGLTVVGANASPQLARTVRAAGYHPWGDGRMVVLERIL
jgi:hypothetical protein